MKKLVFSGFAASMLIMPVSAFATGESTVTSKTYVDDGLRAVYQASKGYTDTKFGTLNTQINGNGTTTFGLVGDVASLQDAINGDGTNMGLAEQINGNGTTTTGLAGDVASLQDTINGDGTNMGLAEQINGNGTTTTGLAGDVATLQQTVGDTSTVGSLAYKVDQLESSSTVYTAGNGINIDTANNNTISVKAGDGLAFDSTTHEITIDGLATTQASGNTTKMYVYQNGTLVPMDVETTWDTNFDFDPEP